MSKIISREVFEFEELSDSAKEIAKDWYLNDDIRGNLLSDDFKESFVRYFFPESELAVQWSLSSCQGDGVNIYGQLRLLELIRYIENWKINEHDFKMIIFNPEHKLSKDDLHKLEKYINQTIDKVEIPSNRRYCYCVADDIDFADEMIEELHELLPKKEIDSDLIHRFEDIAKEAIESLCKEMERYGYDYLYEVTDDEMISMCETNEWFFELDGTFANI